MDSAKENYTQAQQKVEKLNSEIEERNNNIKSLVLQYNSMVDTQKLQYQNC